MQIQTGTAAVTNGDSKVIASAGNDWSGATVGSLFAVTGTGAWYTIGGIQNPGFSASGNWELNLTAPYAGTTNAATQYGIHVDFTPMGMPILSRGDVEIVGLMNRALQKLEAPGNQPRFSAIAGGSVQSIPNATWTKCNFAGEVYDSSNCFSGGRFTPNVPGWYKFDASTTMQALAGSSQHSLKLYKNGAPVAIIDWRIGQFFAIGASHLVSANGVTDYFEAWVYQDQGAALNLGANADCHFDGWWVKPL